MAVRVAALAEALAAPTELEQATGVLAAAGYQVADLPLGVGDRLLLGLHRELTGRDVTVAATCPACGVTGEVELGPDSVPAASPPVSTVVRAPTYADLVGLPSGAAGSAELVRRCTVGDGPATAEDVAAADTSLSGPLVFGCPECGTPVECRVDVEQLALRGLLGVLHSYDREVHLLASAYHWDLATIEALPDDRRRRLAGHVVAER